MSFFSDWDDVTLGNPLEPPRRGPAEVGDAARRVASNFQEGGPLHFEEVSSSFEESPGSPRRSSAMSSRSSGTRAGSPATTTRSSPCCAPPWCSAIRTACGRSPTATLTRSHLHDRRPPSSGPRPRGSSQHTPVRGTSAHRRLTSSAGSCTELSRSGFGVLRHPRWVDGFADRRVGRYAAVQDHRRASACRSPSAFAACRAFETTLGLPSCQAARQPPCKLRSEHWPSTRAGRSQVFVTQGPRRGHSDSQDRGLPT